MIDTINMLVRWTLFPQIAAGLTRDGFYNGGGWKFEIVTKQERTGGTYVKVSGWHELLGIIVRGKDGVIEWVQASLPRLLHGYNGRLITNPFQLKSSFEVLFQRLTEIATAKVRIIEFIRVDLVLNLPGDPRRFVLAHHNARHPWVRRDDLEYGKTGIRFPGKERVLQLYWKQKERADKAGFDLPPLSKSIRAELQIHGKDDPPPMEQEDAS